MCGRATLTKNESEIEQRFQATFYSDDLLRYNPLPSYNIAPTHLHPVITGDLPDQLQLFQWGLIPFWAKEKSVGSKMINARVETLEEKPAFKHALEQRRCIVPFDGFFEWKQTPYGRIPHYIFCKDKELFSVAGLWEKWVDANGQLLQSFTLITLPANEFMKSIHDRMPAILTRENEQRWINPALSVQEALTILQPYPAELMDCYTISERVNKVVNNDADLLRPKNYEELPRQGQLFD
jgi:putative SOS response-associated peptidase YedK